MKAVVWALLAVPACVAFPTKLVQVQHPILTASAPDLGYRVSYRQNGEAVYRGHVLWVEALVGEELQSSGAFGVVSAANGQPLQLDVSVEEHINSVVATLTGFLTTVTLTLLPAYWRSDYDMEAVLSRGGVEVKRYKLHDRETYVIQFFLVFAMPFVDGRSGRVLRNMTRHLVEQMTREGVPP